MPIRVELGPKDLAKNACVLARRDLPGKEGKADRRAAGRGRRPASAQLLERDADRASSSGPRSSATRTASRSNSYDEFKKRIEEPGGFLWAHWDGTRETEDRIAAETKATIRCIPFDRKAETGECMVTGRPCAGRVVFARAY